MLDGGSRQEADTTSSEGKVLRLKTKVPGGDTDWLSVENRAACLPVQTSSQHKDER